MAVGIVRHWSEGHDGHGHKTHPDVRAAAAANMAKWEEARAYAHASTAAKHARGHQTKGDHELAASYQLISSCLLELTRQTVPGWEGSVGPFRGEYGQPHVYARDIHSGAGNCVCGGGPGDRRHVQIAPGVPVPADIKLAGGWPDQPGPPQSSFLKRGTAPGARPLDGRLFHVPSQTVAAGPPLPPDVTLPTPAELNELAAEIKATLPASELTRGAAAHARTAAVKMQANQPVDALHMLRSCQAGIVSAHRAYNASQIPVANVFSSSLDPAEQASAQAAMYEGLGTREKFRSMTTKCAIFRDRIRRHYFHGMYNRMADSRL